jgi:hypothetical protein
MVVTAAEWRKMGLRGILESLETALNVIENEKIGIDEFKMLLDSATRILQILNDHATDLGARILQLTDELESKEDMMKKAFVEDLEEIKTLLEEYNLGKRLLADVWDYINARLEVYMEEK